MPEDVDAATSMLVPVSPSVELHEPAVLALEPHEVESPPE